MNLNPLDKVDWTTLKALKAAKSLPFQYVESSATYTIVLVDANYIVFANVNKTSPTNADQTDFETNFKSAANGKNFIRSALFDPVSGNQGIIGTDGDTVVGMRSKISTANSTTANLTGGQTFTGTFEEILNYGSVSLAVFSSHASAASGLVIEWSMDGSTVHDTDSFSILASVGKQFTFGASYRYARVKYTNGASTTTTLSVQTIYHPMAIKPSSHRLGGTLSMEDDAEVVKSVIVGKDGSGNLVTANVDNDGNLIFVTASNANSGTFIAGDVASADTTLKAVRRTAYTEQTTNAQRSIASANANDTAAGTGARTVRITYLNQTGAGPFTEIVTLNGTAYVNTVSTTICFIEKIEVVTVGSTGSNVGILTLKAATAGGGATIGTVAATDNRTFWAHHYVPSTKIHKLTGVSCSHSSTVVGGGGVFIIRAIQIGVTNVPEIQITDSIRAYGQSSTFSRAYASPVVVTGPAKVTAYVTPESSSSITYRASFDYYEE